ncbi:hypothetical protein BDQ17DRAFT_386132 [Cyathus striatus]|nr:hypothetical protein BDQ17DRAFT_386132 [Cyathus striatus]
MADPPTVLDLQVSQLVQSTLVACGTLLIYDLLCTLDQEVAYVWSEKWSLGTFLFILNRYLPFVDTFLSLSYGSDVIVKQTVNTPEVGLLGYNLLCPSTDSHLSRNAFLCLQR